MTKPIILGTAGHIDHGKTSLIRALTGIDTDRLKEEKERGITIELGFAHLTLPNGQTIGVVDVPGHEKFVRHMVAGATGIDLVALVIAADEGVMPQTREHLDICRLLGVRHGLIVLTKIDLADEELKDLVEDDVEEFVKGTFLEGAPLVPFSAVDGRGTKEVLAAIAEVAGRVKERATGGLFRMPLDRVFTMRGFGTVVTGTALSGALEAGETVMIYPGGKTAKVRGLQVHGQAVPRVVAGQRTAVNLQGLDRDEVLRGQVLALPNTLRPSPRLDVFVEYLASSPKPLKNRTRVRFHVGTSEILGRLLLLDAEELAPGATGFAQAQLEEETAALAGDRFVLRSYSPVRTIAGGEILHPSPTRHKRFQEQLLTDLAVLKARQPVPSLRVFIHGAGSHGVTAADLAGLIDLPEEAIQAGLKKLLAGSEVLALDSRFISREALTELARQVLELLDRYHQEFPLRAGLNKEELKSRIPPLADAKLLGLVLDDLLAAKKVGLERDEVRLAAHRPRLAGGQQAMESRLVTAYQEGGLTPPNLKDVFAQLSGTPAEKREVLDLVVKKGDLVRVKSDLFFHREALERARDVLLKHFRGHEMLTTQEFKEQTGLSRKYLIPLLEYFDLKGLTMRVGESRVLRRDQG
jgi:selenocysteine-specific elongation factor